MKLGLQKMGIGSKGAGLSPASQGDIIWWGQGGVASGTDNEIADRIGTLDAATYEGNNDKTFVSGDKCLFPAPMSQVADERRRFTLGLLRTGLAET